MKNLFWTAVSKVLAIVTVTLIVVLVLMPSAWAADKYQVLRSFQAGSTDGEDPVGSLIFDDAGNLYGITVLGGSGGGCVRGQGCGTAFMLAPNGDGTWTESVIFNFPDYSQGGASWPVAGLVRDGSGNLYGTLSIGGPNCYSHQSPHECGAVFELTPNGDGTWTEKVLHYFVGTDGSWPEAGLIFDTAGNLYGTTVWGGSGKCHDDGGDAGCGTVFKLTPKSDGSWKESVLHSFTGGRDGAYPIASVVVDTAGNLYGTTEYGGAGICPGRAVLPGCGTVFKLTPNPGGRWTETVLHRFTGHNDGGWPLANLTLDAAGTLYGTASAGGTGHCHDYYNNKTGCGLVFSLALGSGGKWAEEVIHDFYGGGQEPAASLIFDAAGSLYSTTSYGGGGGCYGLNGNKLGCGIVFKLVPEPRGTWTKHLLYAFTGGNDGAGPNGSLIFDAAGGLYGATGGGGTYGYGTVFEITP
jgi:uncharacterized protein YceK